MSDLDKARKLHQSSVSEAEKIYNDDFFNEQFRKIEQFRIERDKKIQEAILKAHAEFNEKTKEIEAQTGFVMILTRSTSND